MASSTNCSNDSNAVPENHLDSVSKSLDALTARSNANPPHAPATSSKATSYLRSFFQSDSLEAFENAWHLGNYVIDRETGKKTFEPMSIYVRLGMHFLYYGSGQEAALHWKPVQALLKQQSEKMGAWYDSPGSKSHITPFIESFGLKESLQDMQQPDPAKYTTFNEFFAREIKPSARPIAEPSDPTVISSPADCRLTTFSTIDQATKYWIKGYGFTIAKLLDSSSLAQSFDGGSIAIARLAPQDYHRWHSPIDGKVERITEIAGTYYTVNPQAVTQPGTLDVFCENKLSVMLLRRNVTGSPVAVIAVGAMLVGSIKYNTGVTEGAEVKRGQCLGAFHYGGSTVIVLFRRGEVVFDEDLIANSTRQSCETFVRVGWRIGRGPVQT